MENALWPPGTFLGRLQSSTRERLLSVGVRRSVKEAQVVLREGAQESYVILLDDALVKVTAALVDGRHALLSIRVSGDIIGEISALNETPRTATVTACRPSVVRIVHRNEFMAFLRDHPDAALTVAGIIADRLRWANRRRIDFTSYSVRVRLARVLWEIAAAYGRRSPRGTVVDIRLTQDEMATLCGAAEITLQKALSGLRADGIVDTGYREIVVRDSAALRSIAGLDPQ
ncbi:Crp/Fnr family transcriptional regulator [Micromonospora sp. NBC_01813]|uniref:Crp/Fnr family transcriptional regulator n=1 Tax=Micromonospora sp. NBC_01813 TaxID=2975988 RepID=UPI002DD92B9F|nr:Crp/Fnr family transcriptional regulator [Micromonospora sp. NBC_01813]WSA10907.1 Crp/Fnr family transcriptional regulator [Micromonospora sp. NBC_01813]